MRSPADMSTPIKSDLKQRLINCLLDIQSKLPSLYNTKQNYFPNDKMLCINIIPDNIARAINDNIFENQHYFWSLFAKYILRLLEAIRGRIINLDSVHSPKADIDLLIASLKKIVTELHPHQTSSKSIHEITEEEKKIYDQQCELNKDKKFLAKLDHLKNKAAELGYIPKVLYFSYAWPFYNQFHESWTGKFVYTLALNLRAAGLITELDQLQSCAGVDMFKFMIDGIQRADNILVICDRMMRYKFEEEGDTGVFFEYLEIIRRWQADVERNIDNLNRLAIPICLNESGFVPGLIAKRAQVTVYSIGYLETIKQLLFRIYNFNNQHEFDKLWDNLDNQPTETIEHIAPAQIKELSHAILSSQLPPLAITSSNATPPVSQNPQQSIPVDNKDKVIQNNPTNDKVERNNTQKLNINLNSSQLKHCVTNIQANFDFYQNRTTVEEKLITKIKTQHLVVLAGISGSGKTLLATYYALNIFQKSFVDIPSLAYKIFAHSLNSFRQECIEIATNIKLIVEGDSEQDEKFKYEDALNYIIRLFNQSDMPILLFIDNVDREEVKHELNDKLISRLLLSEKKLVLITSQDSNFYPLGSLHILELEGLELDEIKRFIEKKQIKSFADRSLNAIEKFARPFGNLAFGTTSALLYLLANNMSPEAYLEILSSKEALLDLILDVTELTGEQYKTDKPNEKRNQYWAIWYSIKRCNEKYNESKKPTDSDFNIIIIIMNYLAFLNNASISEQDTLEPIISKICECTTEQARVKLKRILSLLKTYSLINHQETDYISLHQVTQETVKLKLNTTLYKEYVTTLLELLAPDSRIQFDIQQKNLKQISSNTHQLEALYQYAKKEFLSKEKNPKLLLTMARTACRLGANYEMLTSDAEHYLLYFREAATYIQNSTTEAEKIQLARSKHGIAWAYMKMRIHLEEAAQLCKEASDEQNLHKEEKADILKTRGVISRFRNKPQQAITFHEQAITLKREIGNISESAYLDLYRSLSTAFRDMAETHKENNPEQAAIDYEKALNYCNQALHGFSKSTQLSNNYNNIAHAIGNLGGIYLSQGKYELALKFSVAAFLLRVNLLSHDHLYVGQALLKLGECYWAHNKDSSRAKTLANKSKHILIYRNDHEKVEKAKKLLRNFLKPNNDKEYNLFCDEYDKTVLLQKYVFIIENLGGTLTFQQKITLIAEKNIHHSIKLKLLQILSNIIHRKCKHQRLRLKMQITEDHLLLSIHNYNYEPCALQNYFEDCMITLDDKASKFLLLSGANFIDQNELNLLNLTPMFFIKTPSSNIYLEQTINENNDLIFYLLAADKKKVIDQLLDARQQTELRQILSEDILEALSVNSDNALQNIKADIESYKNALLEFEKCRERIIERYYPRICSLTSYDEIIVSTIVENEKGELESKYQQMLKYKENLLIKCTEENIYCFYLNEIINQHYRAGYRLMLAYARLTQNYSIVIFEQNDSLTKEILPCTFEVNDRASRRLFLLKDNHSNQFSLLTDPFVFKGKQSKLWDEYLASFNCNYAVIIQKRDADKIDWSQISNKGYKLILLTYPESLSALKSLPQINSFHEYHAIEDFSYNALLSLITKFVDKYKTPLNDIKLLTTSEDTLISSARIIKKLNIEGIQENVIQPFVNKITTKNIVKLHAETLLYKYCEFQPNCFIENPDRYIQHIMDFLGNIIVAKPAGGMGNRNISILRTADQFKKWCQENVHNSDQYELDEYIEGELLQCDFIVKNNGNTREFLLCNVDRYLVPTHEFMEGGIHGAIILQKSDPEFNRIEQFSKQVLDQFKLIPDGCIGIQLFKKKQDGQLVLLETEARPAGTGICQSLKISTAIDWRAAHYAIQMGLKFTPPTTQSTEFVAWAMFPAKAGMLIKLNDLPAFKSKYSIKWKYKLGDLLPKPASLVDYVGILILSNNNYQELLDDFNQLRTFVPFTVNTTASAVPAAARVDSNQPLTSSIRHTIWQAPNITTNYPIKFLLKNTTIRLLPEQKSLNVIWTDRAMIEQFCKELSRIRASDSVTEINACPYKIIEDNERNITQYQITISSNEYNILMEDNNAFNNLLEAMQSVNNTHDHVNP